jgi:hypothetical protein
VSQLAFPSFVKQPRPAHGNRHNDRLFESGPSHGLQRRLGLVQDKHLNARRRAAAVVLVGWAPLIVLTAVQDLAFRTHDVSVLLYDAGAHARYLLAAPLLILAEASCGAKLSAIVRNFLDAGLVREEQREPFEAAVAATRNKLNSRAVEVAVIALAALVTVSAAISYPTLDLPEWHRSSGDAAAFSPAGWWHVVVSVPLLLILLLGWIWRFAIWAHLLWRISGLDLRLVASHPDRAAGLCFVGESVRAFSPVAAAIAIVAAGRSANVVLADGTMPTPNAIFNASLLLGVVALFAAPLLVLARNLLNVWRDAVFAYGALATRVGTAFESKWLHRNRSDEDTALNEADFSGTTDLYGIVSNVYALRFIPLDLNSVLAICAAVLLPFVPVMLLAFPLAAIWSQLKSLLF